MRANNNLAFGQANQQTIASTYRKLKMQTKVFTCASCERWGARSRVYCLLLGDIFFFCYSSQHFYMRMLAFDEIFLIFFLPPFFISCRRSFNDCDDQLYIQSHRFMHTILPLPFGARRMHKMAHRHIFRSRLRRCRQCCAMSFASF